MPQSYREGALALGSGKWHMVRTVVLPNAVDGIVTGCILAVGRVVGESAALLFTAGFGLKLLGFAEALQSSAASLTVALYIYASEEGKFDVAFSIAVILICITLIINLAASLVGMIEQHQMAVSAAHLVVCGAATDAQRAISLGQLTAFNAAGRRAVA